MMQIKHCDRCLAARKVAHYTEKVCKDDETL